MGLFFSCCRRRKESAEREPLLPKHRVDAAADEYLPSRAQLAKWADVLAAFKAGKLPSQDQANYLIGSLLRSGALQPISDPAYRSLSEPGKQMLLDVREVLESLLLLGLEKNADDELQELVYQLSKIPLVPVHADVIVNAAEDSTLDVQDVVAEIPSHEQVTSDAAQLVHALRQLSTILLTSSTFRIILSDLFKTAREAVADTAADVGRIAAAVEASADKVEETLRPHDATLDDVKVQLAQADNNVSGVSAETKERWKHLGVESPERTKEAVVGRIQQAIAQAHSNPSYQRALRTILQLLQDYTKRLTNVSTALAYTKAPSITPVVWEDSHLSAALAHLRILLSRLASGYPLEHLTDRLRTAALEITKLRVNAPELQAVHVFFADLRTWFDRALASPQYATSTTGQRGAETLYDRARELMRDASQSDALWVVRVRELVHETDVLIEALARDRATTRFLNASSALSAALLAYTQTATRSADIPRKLQESKRQLRSRLKRDVLQWLLPRLLRALRVVPLPRVEFRSPSLDAAIDTIYLTPTSAQLSLVPDQIRVQHWTEVQLDMPEMNSSAERIVPTVHVDYGGMQTRATVRVSMRGIRISARDIGYYACYRLFGRSSRRWFGWMGYEDEGLASVDVGGRGVMHDGLALNLELEYTDNNGEEGEEEGEEPLFYVRDVRVDVPGLRMSLDKSNHWILNKLVLQPFAGPVGRVAIAWVLQRQVRAWLEALGALSGKAVWDAKRSARRESREAEIGDYITAMWGAVTTNAQSEEEEEEQPYQDEEFPLIETRTTATTKGIVRTTVTHSADTDTADPVEESTLAIGVGEQILPGKGGPHGHTPAAEDDEYGPRELAREALDEVQGRVNELVEAEEEAVERGTDVLVGVEDAVGRERRRERREARRGGWRSEAFSF